MSASLRISVGTGTEEAGDGSLFDFGNDDISCSILFLTSSLDIRIGGFCGDPLQIADPAGQSADKILRTVQHDVITAALVSIKPPYPQKTGDGSLSPAHQKKRAVLCVVQHREPPPVSCKTRYGLGFILIKMHTKNVASLKTKQLPYLVLSAAIIGRPSSQVFRKWIIAQADAVVK